MMIAERTGDNTWRVGQHFVRKVEIPWIYHKEKKFYMYQVFLVGGRLRLWAIKAAGTWKAVKRVCKSRKSDLKDAEKMGVL